MNSLDLYSMFMLGLLGTGHCVGMCGPLVLAFPAQAGGMGFHLAYHTGRVSTYAAIGTVLGAAGVVLEKATSCCTTGSAPILGLIQVGFSVLAAVLLLVLGLSRLNVLGEPEWLNMSSPTKIPGFGKIMRLASNRNPVGMFLMGFLMGLLPCGLSYAAFARALTARDAPAAALLVATFGIGTIPGLFLMGTGCSRFLQRYRKQSDILSGLLMFWMAGHLLLQIAKRFIG